MVKNETAKRAIEIEKQMKAALKKEELRNKKALLSGPGDSLPKHRKELVL